MVVIICISKTSAYVDAFMYVCTANMCRSNANHAYVLLAERQSHTFKIASHAYVRTASRGITSVFVGRDRMRHTDSSRPNENHSQVERARHAFDYACMRA